MARKVPIVAPGRPRHEALRRLPDIVVGTLVALLVAMGIVAAYALAHEFWVTGLERERERGSVTAVGALLTVPAPFALVWVDPAMSGPGCVLPQGSVARSLGEAGEDRVKVVVASVVSMPSEAASAGGVACAAEAVGYARLYGTWFVRHHE